MQVSALKERGIIRILADNNIIDISLPPKEFDIRKYKSVAGIVDRLVVGKKIKGRLIDSLETAYRLGFGYLRIFFLTDAIKKDINDNIIESNSFTKKLAGKKIKVVLINDSEWFEISYSSHFCCNKL